MLVPQERRTRERPPRVRRRVVGDSVGERVTAAASAPAEHLFAGPNDRAETVMHPEERRARKLPPLVRRGVVGEPRRLSPDEHLLAGPYSAEAAEGRRLRRGRQLVPVLGARVVGSGDIDAARGVRVSVLVEGRLLVAAEDEHLLAGPDADTRIELRRDGRRRQARPAAG